MHKKFALLFTLIFFLFSGTSIHAAPAKFPAVPATAPVAVPPRTVTEAVPAEKQLMLRQPDGKLVSIGTAITGRYQILLPVELVKEQSPESRFWITRESGRAYLDISQPDFRLETSKTSEWLQPGIQLNFLTKTINNRDYINVWGLETLLGLRFTSESAVPAGSDKNKDSKDNTGKTTSRLILEPLTLPKGSPAPMLNQPRTSARLAGRVNLAWDYVHRHSPDLAKEEPIKGLNVLSPTWFAITDSDGTVTSNADARYVQDAHDKNYKVWALITNSFDEDLTRDLLQNSQAQDNVIRQLVVYASLYNLDGVNIDFENVYTADRDRLTAFTARLADALKEQKVTLSMDTTVPIGQSRTCYDWKALSESLDYLMIMTYDEHWQAGPSSGSVASLNWVERGVANSLNYVPKDRLVMGIPFYTREWEEVDSVKIRSRVFTMADTEARIKEINAPLVWLPDSGQYYLEYYRDGRRYRIWVEDENSIRLKAGLVGKYNLAGAASWRRGFENKNVWDALQVVHESGNE
ncbi:MAG TPA: glycosyl hydrolase family 18 protein [Patescibacteria group bacterium]|nr:glycosyl hydrolase family 18 protein [Patescibacteria group bacterium]